MLDLTSKLNAKLGQIIVKNGLIDKKVVNDILVKLENTGVYLTSHLMEYSLLTESQVAFVEATLMGKEIYNIDLLVYDEKIVSNISKPFVENHHLLPIRCDQTEGGNGYIYTVVIGDVLDPMAERTAKNLFGDNVVIYYSMMSKLINILSVVHTKSNVKEAITEYSNMDAADFIDEESEEDASVTTAPAVKLVESILKEAIASKASDIHIEPYDDKVRVRNRIDGTLYEKSSFDPKMYSAVVTRFKIVSGLNITEKRIPQDGRFSINFNNDKYDFRLSTLPTVHGEKIVIRILDTSAFSFNMKELGFTEKNIKIIRPILETPHGIILLTGPTGCGKSTTLYSFIREVNTPGVNIVSVEDPVEYSISGINQVQVNNKANMTFASALRSILRQDPNIIMIGEIRDEETAHIAIRSAITGHLVFSTLHTNDAPGAVTRLADMGVEPYLVADALEMVIAQRLIRRLCKECKKKVQTTPEQMKILGIKKPVDIFAPVGCPACHNTGYRGRLGIHEVLVMDDKLREIVTHPGAAEKINEYLKEKKFVDLRAACIEAILRGDTSFVELFSISSHED